MFAAAFFGLAHLYYAVHDLDPQIPGRVSDKENTDPAEEISLYFEALQHAGPNGGGTPISEVALAMRTRTLEKDDPVPDVTFPESDTEGPEEVSIILDDSPLLIPSLVSNGSGSSKRRKRADSTSEDDRRPSKNVKSTDVVVVSSLHGLS